MPGQDDDDDGDLVFFGPPRAGARIIRCTPPQGERIRRMKARYVFRVVSGDRAKKNDARQAKAIMEVLEWIPDHPDQAEQPRTSSGETAR